jgi:hypothetical protein
MTTDTIPPPTAPKKRTSHRKTIFSLMGITFLMTCLFIGFGQGAGNDNAPVSEDNIDANPGEFFHESICYSDTEIFGFVTVEEWILWNTIDDPKDLQACIAQYGPYATHSKVFHLSGFSESYP